jgi:tripartite-type tricarboxylate transporter receptor subunit TctC
MPKLPAAGAVLLAATLAFGAAVRAQETLSIPSGAITLVTPLGPGTTIDILARLDGERLAKRFGRQVIVSNRPGAGGLIAAQAVAGAPADGTTLLVANSAMPFLARSTGTCRSIRCATSPASPWSAKLRPSSPSRRR